MKVNYIGNRSKYCRHGQRKAEVVAVNEETELNAILELMENEFGYKFSVHGFIDSYGADGEADIVTDYAYCDVADRDEFEQLMRDWKYCKKTLKK